MKWFCLGTVTRFLLQISYVPSSKEEKKYSKKIYNPFCPKFHENLSLSGKDIVQKDQIPFF